MQKDFWHKRWQAGEIGFHKRAYNTQLKRFIDLLGIEQGDHVLVPLCGKSLDIIWLHNMNYRVTGIEISPLAVESFFTENDIKFITIEHDWGLLYQAEGLNILCADFFDIQSVDLPPVDAVYDRASLIAMPEDMRSNYVAHLTSLMPDTTRSLLITLDYPQQEMDGPPFAVSASEVENLFGQQFIIESIISEDCLVDEPHFQKKGLSKLDEQVFLLTRNIP